VLRVPILAVVFSATLLLWSNRFSFAQPLLREGDAEADQQTAPDPEESDRSELARQKAHLEEERRLKLQEELMRLQGEQIQAAQEQIKRRDVLMRYALIISVAVVATTLLIAYARSRVAERDDKPRGT
jgi:hypothetical protein